MPKMFLCRITLLTVQLFIFLGFTSSRFAHFYTITAFLRNFLDFTQHKCYNSPVFEVILVLNCFRIGIGGLQPAYFMSQKSAFHKIQGGEKCLRLTNW